MKPFQSLLVGAMLLTTTAYASNVTNDPADLSAVHVQPASAAVTASHLNGLSTAEHRMPLHHDAASTAETAANGGEVAADVVPTQAEPETDDFYAEMLDSDPWEGFNRKVHSFNNSADKLVLRPLAVVYKKIAPEPVRTSISRFLANLGMPVTMVNQILQGRPSDAARSLGRFAVNTTGGVFGFFDPATYLGIPSYDHEDFGQTLGTWGWRDSRYLVLPLLGPRTLRDALGILGDRPLSPIVQIQDSGVARGLQAMEIIDVRTRLLPLDQLRRDAIDDYVYVRSAWIQRRNHLIQQDMRSARH